jgi:crotonobetainyl-CoA:carnitine CoA-transferase CaiB-like acyl-CoA transferase
MPPPRLSEHTEGVLSELGYSADEIKALKEKSVI